MANDSFLHSIQSGIGVGNRFANSTQMSGSELEQMILSIGVDPAEFFNQVFSGGGLVDILTGVVGLKNLPNSFGFLNLESLSVLSHSSIENLGLMNYLANSSAQNGKQSMWYAKR